MSNLYVHRLVGVGSVSQGQMAMAFSPGGSVMTPVCLLWRSSDQHATNTWTPRVSVSLEVPRSNQLLIEGYCLMR